MSATRAGAGRRAGNQLEIAADLLVLPKRVKRFSSMAFSNMKPVHRARLSHFVKETAYPPSALRQLYCTLSRR